MKAIKNCELISEGTYGKVYNYKDKYAIKVETEEGKEDSRLATELKLLRHCKGDGIPKVIKTQNINGEQRMVMPLLGKDVKELYRQNGRKLSMRSILLFGIQALDRLKHIHSKGVIHRDIKGENFCIGKEDPTKIYLIDFGLSKLENAAESKSLDLAESDEGFVGNLLFSSSESHLYKKPTKISDLESLCYLMVYLHNGSKSEPNSIELPWEKEYSLSEEDLQKALYNMKKLRPIGYLCKGFPKSFRTFAEYIRDLGSDHSPDISYLKKLLLKCLKEKKYPLDFCGFDWVKTKKSTVKKGKSKKSTKGTKKDFSKKRQAKVAQGNIKDRLRGRVKQAELEILKSFI